MYVSFLTLTLIVELFLSHLLFSLHQVLKHEVELMSKMAKTIDGFTQNQTRMAVIIDGLDACEQDKVLQMLDTVCVCTWFSAWALEWWVQLPLCWHWNKMKEILFVNICSSRRAAAMWSHSNFQWVFSPMHTDPTHLLYHAATLVFPAASARLQL